MSADRAEPSAPTRPPVLLRPALHAATGLCALLLGVLPHWAAIACGIGGVLIGWIGFPLTGLDRTLRRPGEPYLAGLRSYPVAILGLIILLPPAEAAAAWGVLAFGDAGAALIGQTVRAARIFGHPKATWSGSLAHVVLGTLGAVALSRGAVALGSWAGGIDPGLPPTLLACFLAAVAAASADLVFRVADDNLTGAAAAGAVLAAARSLL